MHDHYRDFDFLYLDEAVDFLGLSEKRVKKLISEGLVQAYADTTQVARRYTPKGSGPFHRFSIVIPPLRWEGNIIKFHKIILRDTKGVDSCHYEISGQFAEDEIYLSREEMVSFRGRGQKRNDRKVSAVNRIRKDFYENFLQVAASRVHSRQEKVSYKNVLNELDSMFLEDESLGDEQTDVDVKKGNVTFQGVEFTLKTIQDHLRFIRKSLKEK